MIGRVPTVTFQRTCVTACVGAVGRRTPRSSGPGLALLAPAADRDRSPHRRPRRHGMAASRMEPREERTACRRDVRE